MPFAPVRPLWGYSKGVCSPYSVAVVESTVPTPQRGFSLMVASSLARGADLKRSRADRAWSTILRTITDIAPCRSQDSAKLGSDDGRVWVLGWRWHECASRLRHHTQFGTTKWVTRTCAKSSARLGASSRHTEHTSWFLGQLCRRGSSVDCAALARNEQQY